MNKRLIYVNRIALVLVAISFQVHAQDILLDEKPGEVTKESNFGKNRKHYISGYIGGGWFASGTTGSAIYPLTAPYVWRSGESFGGGFYKRKWNEYLSSVVFIEGMVRTSSRQRQSDTLRYEYSVSSLSLGLNKRINFKKRGDHYGLYLELGAQTEWLYDESLLIINRSADDEYKYRKKRSRIKGLDYTNPFNYNLNARFGHNGFSLYGRYRMQPLFREETGFDLPVMTAGVIWDFSF